MSSVEITKFIGHHGQKWGGLAVSYIEFVYHPPAAMS